MKINVVTNILDANNRIADENRALFDSKRIFVINLMSSPGAGKTSLVEHTIDALAEQGVIRPYVCAAFPLDQAIEAMRMLQDRKVIGKVVITP